MSRYCAMLASEASTVKACACTNSRVVASRVVTLTVISDGPDLTDLI